MKTFKQFLYEMPSLYKSVAGAPTAMDRENHMDSIHDQMKRWPRRKVSETDTHKVYKAVHVVGRDTAIEQTAHEYSFINKKTGKLDGHLGGVFDKKTKTQQSNGLYTRPRSIKAHEMIHHLIHHHGLNVRSSDNQNPGSAKTWQNLHAMPDISMRRESGKKIDTENWHKNYGRSLDWEDPDSKDTFIATKK